MYGAILGDIIGSPFEFDRGEKTKDFDADVPKFLSGYGCGCVDRGAIIDSMARNINEKSTGCEAPYSYLFIIFIKFDGIISAGL